MKVMNCPLNGPRNISEFTYGGEFKAMPDPATCTDDEWADYVFNCEDTLGVVREWWMHTPSSYWFLVERHTGSDEILRTFDPREVFTSRVDFSATPTAPAKEIAP